MATALVVIDVQEAMFLQPTPPHDGPGVVDRIAGLLARARADACRRPRSCSSKGAEARLTPPRAP
jgi:nicotinamidase-related amidase